MRKLITLKFVTASVLLSLVLTLPVKSQSLQSSSTKSTQTVQVPVSLIEKAKRAADEVKASRELISKQEDLIPELKKNLALEQTKSATLEGIVSLQKGQLSQYETVIVPNLKKENEIKDKKIASLERSNRRWKKFGISLGVILTGVIYGVTR